MFGTCAATAGGALRLILKLILNDECAHPGVMGWAVVLGKRGRELRGYHPLRPFRFVGEGISVPSMNDEKLTYSITEAAAMIPCNERWLLDKLRAGGFPARKMGREWRMTLADINRAIEICAATTTSVQARALSSLAPETQRRLRRS